MKLTLEKIKEVFVKNQLPETFGIEMVEIGEDFLVGTLTVDSRHLRPGNIMNGGVSLVLLETMGSASACLFVDLTKQNAFGIQVSANHLSVARPGDQLIARSQAVHIGKTTHVWEVTITNQKKKIVSTGRITMLITYLV
jgi:1,4-dihydroxy-2-naphthoyl-CoA hydrolase